MYDMNRKAHVTCNFNYLLENEGFLKVRIPKTEKFTQFQNINATLLRRVKASSELL